MPASTTSTECWNCGSGVPASRLDVETVIHSRRQQDGGPYRSFRCAGCGVTNGALRNRRGSWLLYPLEGADEPSLIDWISPRFDRRMLRAAVEWWARHRGRVIRFRQEAPGATVITRDPDRIREVSVESDSILIDLDTPADYVRIRELFRRRPR